jgi:hypothetical protein
MTPAEERRFIRLWTQEASYRAIAQALGCALGTVASRAAALMAQGKIQPRPRDGAYPRRQALARPGDPPVPQVAPATPVPPAMTFVAVPEIQEILSIVKELQTRVASLEQTRVPPALPAPPASHATPAPPTAERKEIQQWTVRLSKALIEHLKAVAYERRQPPSQLLEELVWQALNDR